MGGWTQPNLDRDFGWDMVSIGEASALEELPTSTSGSWLWFLAESKSKSKSSPKSGRSAIIFRGPGRGTGDGRRGRRNEVLSSIGLSATVC